MHPAPISRVSFTDSGDFILPPFSASPSVIVVAQPALSAWRQYIVDKRLSTWSDCAGGDDRAVSDHSPPPGHVRGSAVLSRYRRRPAQDGQLRLDLQGGVEMRQRGIITPR